MREITKLMIKEYRLMKLGYDFMGYDIKQREHLSFHHLIVPHRNCKAMGLGDGYLRWNGAILTQSKSSDSHGYLHTIENYDYERFLAITNELIEQNLLGKLDRDCLIRIHDILKSFEREYHSKRTKKGALILRPEYMRRRDFSK